MPATAPWLTVTPRSGHLAIDQTANLKFSVDRAVPPGDYDVDVTITAVGFEQFPVVVPVSFYVYDAETPRLHVTPMTLDYSTTVGIHPPGQHVTVSNPGTLPLEWQAWPNVSWISVVPPHGEGPAGYSEEVSLIVHPEGLAPGGPYIGTVTLFSNAPGGSRDVTARLVVGPCEEAFCDQGWLCSGTTHLCEPPQACTHATDCPIGQDCEPETHLCQMSGMCMGDPDCQFVWSPYGATKCDIPRMTCELASCASDPDCPSGSYCDEPSGRCPVSSTCGSDAECFPNAAFAFKCDVARTSCIPALCTNDPDCPVGSYCDESNGQCLASQVCASDADCVPIGAFSLTCDVPRTSCIPTTCINDLGCPAASYCSQIWDLCIATAPCTTNQNCFQLGMQCDVARNACRP